tara:strand:+ start:112 stop:444 length:333 start_codon:yes stop_codon:yes gene_type:complete
MKRLIDDKEATAAKLFELYGTPAFAKVFENGMFNRLIEELYAPLPEWKDKLDPNDSETWVLCFVSDYSPTSRECVVWVTRCECGSYPFTTVPCGLYKYATPVDLSIRYEV